MRQKTGMICITGPDVNHIRNVLRMKTGEKVRVSDRSGHAFFCCLEEIAADYVSARIEYADETGTELDNPIWLFQGLPKSDKMELIIQKATELGVSEVIPVSMKNCVVKLDAKKADNKNKRWQTIAESAAKQSKRTVIPVIRPLMNWKEALELAKTLDVVLLSKRVKNHLCRNRY